MKESTSQAASQAYRVWIPEMFGKPPTIMLPSVSRPYRMLRHSIVVEQPDPREPGSDQVTDIYTYLRDPLTYSCLGNKADQKFEKSPGRLRTWLALLSRIVTLQNICL